MCLLLAAVGVVDGHPVVCVANRDEYFDRASDPPASRGGDPQVWCGFDRRAGGTWLGMNAAGVVVVLTNRRGEQSPTRPSRGAIALAALAADCTDDAVVAAERLAIKTEPNPFSLFVADARQARFLAYNGRGTRDLPEVSLRPGLHTLTNTHDLDELPASDVLRAADGGPVELPRGVSLPVAEARMLRVAKSHAPVGGGARGAVCVHGQGRGTVSSALLAVHTSGRPARFLAADGAPCVTPFRDVIGATGAGQPRPSRR